MCSFCLIERGNKKSMYLRETYVSIHHVFKAYVFLDQHVAETHQNLIMAQFEMSK